MTIRDKITPGPWRYTNRSDVSGIPSANSTIPFAIERPYGYSVLPIADICNFPPATENQTAYQEANALAISKVPEMLELIERLTTNEDIAIIIHDAHDLWEELNKHK